MGDWSDWYLKEDTTEWVLPKILKARAEEHPDRDFLKFGDGKWLSYKTINNRANQIANALLAPGWTPRARSALALWFARLLMAA